uniref:Uncharacterized protein n=1 Tax=Romanomermis culicivorax TaxID=13658 RepID=A0A915IC41_ROMCU
MIRAVYGTTRYERYQWATKISIEICLGGVALSKALTNFMFYMEHLATLAYPNFNSDPQSNDLDKDTAAT